VVAAAIARKAANVEIIKRVMRSSMHLCPHLV
jgi:hypothetical protein